MIGRSELGFGTQGTPGDSALERGRYGRATAFDDSELVDMPVAPTLRRVSANDPFPPCRARLRWPAGCSVRDLADLADDEEAETDPSRFVYSDAELDAWATIVNTMLEDVIGPQLPNAHAHQRCMPSAPLVGPEDHRRWRR